MNYRMVTCALGGSLPVFHKILIPFILPISRKLCYTLYQTTHRPGGTAMPAGTVRRRPYLDEQSERERQSRKRSSLAYWIVTIVFLVSQEATSSDGRS